MSRERLGFTPIDPYDRNHTGFGWASADNHNWTDFNLFGITYGELEKAPWNAWDSVNKEWRTHKVLLVAMYREFIETGLPKWFRDCTPATGRSVYFYQRLQPLGPRYAPNFAQEGGIMAKFVYDFYPNLPNITILLEAEPETRVFMRYIECLLPNVSYTSMQPWAVRTRNNLPKANPYELVWFENCVREVLRIVGQPLQRGESFFPLTFTTSGQFAVAKQVLLRQPHRVWKEIYERLGRGPICSNRQPKQVELFQKVPAGAIIPEQAIKRGRLANGRLQAHVLEMFEHAVFGNRPIHGALVPLNEAFYDDAECPGSPNWSNLPKEKLSPATLCLRTSFGRVWTQCKEEVYSAMPQHWLNAFAAYSGRIYMLQGRKKLKKE
eukprot:EG_transcript_10561